MIFLKMRIMQRTEHKPLASIGVKMIVFFRNTTNDIGRRFEDRLISFRYIKDFLPNYCFNFRYDIGTVVSQRF
jgi:hypothetical protein